MRYFGRGGPYWGPIQTPEPYAAYPVRFSDYWRWEFVFGPGSPGTRNASCTRDGTSYMFRAYIWDLAFYGPIHQLSGVSFRLQSEISTPTLGDIVQVYVGGGGDVGSDVAYLLNGSGQVFGFGSGYDGVLGQGDTVDHDALPPIAIDVDGQPVQRLMRGNGETFDVFAVTVSGELWGWGPDELLLARESGTLSAVRVLSGDLVTGSVLDVAVMGSNAVFVRRIPSVPQRQLQPFAAVLG